MGYSLEVTRDGHRTMAACNSMLHEVEQNMLQGSHFGQGGPTSGDNASMEDVITYLDSARVTDSWDHNHWHREREPSEYHDLL